MIHNNLTRPFPTAALLILAGLLCITQLQAGITFGANQYEVSVAPGYNHVPISIPYTPSAPDVDEDAITVSSDVSWAIPTINAATDTIEVSFTTDEIISTYTATISVDDGSTTQDLFLTATVSPLSVYRLLDDPFRARAYGIHHNGIYDGNIIAFEPSTLTPIACITVGARPTDFVISEDGTELLVICSVAKRIDVIDLVTFTFKESINLPSYGAWGSADDTTANIELGAGDIIYYLDGAWGPTLHTLDRSSGTVLQSMKWNGSAPTNSTGFMDIAVTSDKQHLIAMPQYGWSAGSHSATIGQFSIASDGRVSPVKTTAVNGFQREPFEAPVLMRSDDSVAVMKTISANPANSDQLERSFPSAIWSMNPNGTIVATHDKLYDYESGLELHTLPLTNTYNGGYTYTKAQAFTSDFTYFVFFDSGSRTLKSVDLVTTIGLEAIGRVLTPANGSVVTSPEVLTWGGFPGVDQYDIYIGTSESGVDSATTTSGQYLGRVTGTEYTLLQALNVGTTYYWRIDPVSAYGIETGTVFSFTVSDLALDKTEIKGRTITGHSNYQVDLALTSETPVSWTANATASWISFNQNTGTTPATLTVSLDASELPIGFNSAEFSITTGGDTITIPVKLEVEPLHLTHIRSDRNTSTVYAISEDTTAAIRRAFLLEIDSESESIQRVLGVGGSVTDCSISYPENRIYVTNWQSGNLLVIDLTTFELVKSIAFTPAGATGYSSNDVYRVAAGVNGRIIVEEEDQWIDIDLFDTQNGVSLDAASVRQGGGAFDHTGRYYYHGENNSSGASILKFDIAGDTLTKLAEIRPAEVGSSGSRTVTISEDGNRIFWAGVLLRPDLTTEWKVSDIIYSTSEDGRLAFGENNIYDTNLRRQVLGMPTASRVSGYNSTTGKLIVQVGEEIRFFDMSFSLTLTPPVLRFDSSDHESVMVRWTDDSLEMAFHLQYRLLGDSSWNDAPEISTNEVSYSVLGLDEETSYEFRIRASGSSSSSGWSNIVAGTTTPRPPSIPTLYALSASSDQVLVSWSNVADETGYVLERSTDRGSSWQVIVTLPENVVSYIDSTVSEGTEYWYRVKAVKGSSSSSYTWPGSIITPIRVAPAQPAGMRLIVRSETELLITWNDTSEETGYRLERKIGAEGSWLLLATLNRDTSSYLDGSLQTGTTYSYRLTAFNEKGDSPTSINVTGIPILAPTTLSDDFDPDLDNSVWSAISGGVATNGGGGFPGSNVLWFNGSGTRAATSVAMNLTQGDSIRFSIRAGNEAGENPAAWNNSEASESVALEYSLDGLQWVRIQTLNTVYPSLSQWTAFDIAIPDSAKSGYVQLRWRQNAHSGQSFDQWALDDIRINQPMVVPGKPPFITANANSASEIGVLWIAPSGGDPVTRYIVERRLGIGSWQEVANLPATQTYFTDSGLLPSSFYVYRVKARNTAGDSLYSASVAVETLSRYVDWLFDNYGTIDTEIALRNDEHGINPLLRFGFNLQSGQGALILPESGDVGLPRVHISNEYLLIEYVRRKESSSPGVRYIPEFSANMIDWKEAEIILSVAEIDDTWVRVVVRDTVKVIDNDVRFGRIRLVAE